MPPRTSTWKLWLPQKQNLKILTKDRLLLTSQRWLCKSKVLRDLCIFKWIQLNSKTRPLPSRSLKTWPIRSGQISSTSCSQLPSFSWQNWCTSILAQQFERHQLGHYKSFSSALWIRIKWRTSLPFTSQALHPRSRTTWRWWTLTQWSTWHMSFQDASSTSTISRDRHGSLLRPQLRSLTCWLQLFRQSNTIKSRDWNNLSQKRRNLLRKTSKISMKTSSDFTGLYLTSMRSVVSSFARCLMLRVSLSWPSLFNFTPSCWLMSRRARNTSLWQLFASSVIAWSMDSLRFCQQLLTVYQRSICKLWHNRELSLRKTRWMKILYRHAYMEWASWLLKCRHRPSLLMM